MQLRGKVFSGFGEGEKYVRIYAEKLEEALGFAPFPGTLNLRGEKILLPENSKITVDPPSGKYGPVFCWRAAVCGIECAVLVPKINRYGTDVFEIVAKVELRKALKLKDGDSLTVELL